MVNYFFLDNKMVKMESGNSSVSPNIFWIDLINPTEDEIHQVEKDFRVELFTKQESEEIESSSKYVETEDEIGINLNFLIPENKTFSNEPVSFILKDKILITQRSREFRSFSETYRKLRAIKPVDGEDIFLTILATGIDYDADLIEHITDRISDISKQMIGDKDPNRELLLKITALQETTIAIRENIVEKQRIISSLLKSKMFPKEDYENMRIMIKDVGSLLDHTSFNFERLEFLQNTFLGLVDMEQNRVIKIFTVVTGPYYAIVAHPSPHERIPASASCSSSMARQRASPTGTTPTICYGADGTSADSEDERPASRFEAGANVDSIRVDSIHRSDTPPPDIASFAGQRRQEPDALRYGELRPSYRLAGKGFITHDVGRVGGVGLAPLHWNDGLNDLPARLPPGHVVRQ